VKAAPHHGSSQAPAAKASAGGVAASHGPEREREQPVPPKGISQENVDLEGKR